jgi:5'(3')-deoxyribonucleotidase
MPRVRPRQVYIDLDDTIAAWEEAAARAHGVDAAKLPPPGSPGKAFADMLGMSASQFWAKLNSHEFWAAIPRTDFAHDLVALAVRLAGDGNVCLLTRPTLSPYSASGKVEWIQREFPKLSRSYSITIEKFRLCRPGDVLVDDSQDNVAEWIDCGGVGVLVPSRRNRRAGEPPAACLVDLAAALDSTYVPLPSERNA